MDIKELAQMLGYGGPMPDEGTAPPTGGLADPFALPTPETAPIDPGLGPSALPAPTPLAASPAPLAPGQSVGGKVSASGFSPTKYAQAKKAAAPEDATIAGGYQRAAARSAPDVAAIQAEGVSAKAAETRLASAEAAKSQIEAGQALHTAAIQTKYQNEVKQDYADAQAASDAAKAEYHTKLLQIPTLNPSQLWDAAGSEGQFGMAAAAFLHDFLGAKGIKTSAMDTINGAIKRNIDGQIANINSKRETAAGFKDLWEITRAQSASTAEARARMQSYGLASLKSELAGQMGGYDSAVAQAKHQMASALIDKEINKQVFDVHKHVDDSANQEATRLVAIRGQNMAAATAKAENESHERIAQITSDAKSAGKGPRYVFDPETGKGKFVFKPGVRPEQQDKVLEQVAKFEPANLIMSRLRTLEREAGSQVFDLTRGTRFSDEQQREFTGLATQLAHSLVAARGERPTDKDVIDQLLVVPQKTTFTVGGTSRILAGTQAELNDAVQGTIRQFVDDVPKEQQPQGATGRLAEGSYTDAQIGHAGAPKETTGKDVVDQLGASPAAYAPAENPSVEAVSDWGAFTTSHGIKDKDILKQRQAAGSKAEDLINYKDPDQVFVQIHDIANQAAQGNAGSMQDLVGIATRTGAVKQGAPKLGGGGYEQYATPLTDAQKLAKDYAEWELKRINAE